MKSRLFSKDNALILGVIIVSFLIGLYFCQQKSGYYFDEVITIGQANSSKGGWIGDIRAEYTDGNMIGRNITGKEIFDYLTVDKSELFDVASSYKNLVNDVHPPLYQMLLKVCYSFVTSTFSGWPGLILNLILFVAGNFLMFKICHSLFDNKSAASITTLLYALSPSTLSSLIFIRMYLMLSVLTMLLLYEVILLLRERRKIIYPIITVTILTGMMTQYFFVIPAFYLCLSVLIILLLRKEIKSAVLFSVSALTGVGLLFAVFPLFFEQMGVSFSEDETIVNHVTMNAASLGFDSSMKILLENFQIFFSDSLPAVELAIVSVAVLSVLIVYLYYRKDKGDVDISLSLPKNKEAKPVLIAAFFTLFGSFVTISLTTNHSLQRYFHHIQAFIYPFVCLIFCIVAHYTGQIWKKALAVLTAVSLTAVFAASFVVIKNRPLPYLFMDYRKYVSMLSDYNHSPCLYVSSGENKMVSETALQFLVNTDNIYVVHASDLDKEKIDAYLDMYKDKDALVVHVYWMDDKEKEFVDSLASLLGYRESKLLFRYDSNRDACYLLK